MSGYRFLTQVGDTYYDSQFGLVDSILDKKMGFVSKRKAVMFVVTHQAG